MYFSPELLKDVGGYLSKADQAACALVCYEWYSIFLDLLYTTVEIHSRHQFRLFYQTIKASSEMDDSLGTLVKELRFSYNKTTKHRVGFSRHELESFATYFHNLRILDFDPQLWKYMRYPVGLSRLSSLQQLPELNRKAIFQPLFYCSTQQQDVEQDQSNSTMLTTKSMSADRAFLSQLTYLSLSGQVTEFLIKENLTTSFWHRVPRVEKLVITGNNSACELNVKTIMSIGAQLNSLKDFTLVNVTLPLEDDDINSITMLPLFTSTLSLTLSDVHVKDWRMITLLSLAFYRIEVLDLHLTLDWFYQDDVTVEVYETCMDAFMGFAQLCTHLKTVRFRRMNTSVFPFAYDAFFHEISELRKCDHVHYQQHPCQKCVAIEMIDAAWWATIDPASSFKTATTVTGLLSKTHIQFSWTGKKTDTHLFKSLRFCQNLTELNLECDIPLRHGLRLDLLLDNCKVLQNVSLSNALVTISDRHSSIDIAGNPPPQGSSNPLKSLKMKHVYLGDRLIDYLAHDCSKLNELWITNCVQEKARKTSFIVIRMPEHRFKHIKLSQLHLNPGGPKAKCEANMTLLSLFESMRYEKQSKRLQTARKKEIEREKSVKDKEQLDASTSDPSPHHRKSISAPEMWRFYHVYKPNIHKNNTTTTTTTTKHTTDTMTDKNNTHSDHQQLPISTEALNKQLRRLNTEEAAMIANFEMTDKKWKAARNAQRRKTYTEKQFWEKDIQFGAVLLVCKSVDKLEFNDLTV
ncbi:hypothetical protein BDF20DRAFT_94937 [Mycotypha africana]|uniref:uncharacterized protein n=1 Tax=Mycotypha africana TaxID=64632 RepID=UPI002301F140|nr:uncharacterized protein BDF20DRAFT_94937 [Mycotypha africana]KAI8969936.1 hypothetical protein BDF20DRAFT_94937 [Mycotypha africana]